MNEAGTVERGTQLHFARMSLDGLVAGPDDGKEHPLGRHGGMNIFDWYFSGTEEYLNPLFRPAPGANRQEVERMFAESGAFIFGRRTYEITSGSIIRQRIIRKAPPISLSSPTASKAQSAKRVRWRSVKTLNLGALLRGRKRLAPDFATKF